MENDGVEELRQVTVATSQNGSMGGRMEEILWDSRVRRSTS